jgi:hypothetical protein
MNRDTRNTGCQAPLGSHQSPRGAVRASARGCADGGVVESGPARHRTAPQRQGGCGRLGRQGPWPRRGVDAWRGAGRRRWRPGARLRDTWLARTADRAGEGGCDDAAHEPAVPPAIAPACLAAAGAGHAGPAPGVGHQHGGDATRAPRTRPGGHAVAWPRLASRPRRRPQRFPRGQAFPCTGRSPWLVGCAACPAGCSPRCGPDGTGEDRVPEDDGSGPGGLPRKEGAGVRSAAGSADTAPMLACMNRPAQKTCASSRQLSCRGPPQSCRGTVSSAALSCRSSRARFVPVKLLACDHHAPG